MYWVFGCLSVLEGCSLSPEWPELGDNGGAHGTSPMKPIICQPYHPCVYSTLIYVGLLGTHWAGGSWLGDLKIPDQPILIRHALDFLYYLVLTGLIGFTVF